MTDQNSKPATTNHVWVTANGQAMYESLREAFRDHTPLTWTIEGRTLTVTIDSFSVTQEAPAE